MAAEAQRAIEAILMVADAPVEPGLLAQLLEVTPARIEENFDVFDFQLSDAEMDALEGLDAGRRTGPDPDTFVRP